MAPSQGDFAAADQGEHFYPDLFDSPKAFIPSGSSATNTDSLRRAGAMGSPGSISYRTSNVASPLNSSNKLEYVKIESDNFQHDYESCVGDSDQYYDHERRSQETNQDNPDHTPAWTDMKTKAGKDRKRLPLACIACRRKKIRCSGENPGCKHCLKSRIPCVYKVTTRKAAPRTDYMAMLDKRLKRMEERVIKIIPKNEVERIPAVTRAIVKPNTAILQAKWWERRGQQTKPLEPSWIVGSVVQTQLPRSPIQNHSRLWPSKTITRKTGC